MTSDPSSGPGAGVVASKRTAISSAQIKALYTVPVAVSSTPRSDQIIAPLSWVATADDSSVAYVASGGQLFLGYSSAGGVVPLADLLNTLISGSPSFLVGNPAALQAGLALSDALGNPLVMFIDTGNLTAGNFAIVFTLLYYVITP